LSCRRFTFLFLLLPPFLLLLSVAGLGDLACLPLLPHNPPLVSVASILLGPAEPAQLRTNSLRLCLAAVQAPEQALKVPVLLPRDPAWVLLMRGADPEHVELLVHLEVRGAAVAGGAEALGRVPAELGEVALPEARGICRGAGR
jgi:hypothetical protein